MALVGVAAPMCLFLFPNPVVAIVAHVLCIVLLVLVRALEYLLPLSLPLRKQIL